MLKDSLFKYYFFKIKFLFCKQKFNRDPFATKLKNQPIIGTVGELIEFVTTKYTIETIEVKLIHRTVNWNKFFKDLSKREIAQLDNFHMRLVVNSDLKYPIIVTSNIEGRLGEILDGFHRVKKAYMLRKKTIKTYIVPEIDLKQFKTQSDGKI